VISNITPSCCVAEQGLVLYYLWENCEVLASDDVTEEWNSEILNIYTRINQPMLYQMIIMHARV
jgi:hypothetical protein